MIYRFQRTLAYRLLAWSTLSILWGLYLIWFQVGDNPYKNGLGLQLIVWAVIDAVIALFALRGLTVKMARVPDPAQIEKDSVTLRRILLINAGLDVIYLTIGLILILTLGQTDAFARGSGVGILIQGGFLFLFDLFHALAIPHEKKLPHLSQFDQPAHLPFDLPGKPGERSDRGTMILVHGFPGTPAEMRDLGEAFSEQGWRTIGLLLPGFGSDIDNLFQQRASSWIDAIARAVGDARAQTRGPVLLTGFSMGGGLSVSAAAQARPDALVLISPFWFDVPPVLIALFTLIGIFLPESFNPTRLIPAERLQRSAAFHPPPGNIYPPAPELINSMNGDVHVPLLFLEQFGVLSRLAKENAPRITCPVFIVQGNNDPIVRPQLTRRLAAMFPSPPQVSEVAGDHHITIQNTPGYKELAAGMIAWVKTQEWVH
jgi:carboxylesterase